MHEKNIMHRDIKPENILLGKNMEIKVCDFGWSTRNQNTRETFCGTFEYMSPEILENKSYDKSVDIWSLGILLFELYHNRSPFKGKS